MRTARIISRANLPHPGAIRHHLPVIFRAAALGAGRFPTRAGKTVRPVTFVSLAFLASACSGVMRAPSATPDVKPTITLPGAQPAPATIAAPTTTPFAGEVAEASQRFGVPVSWIRAVMHAESRGRERAVSRKGAMGLMQIMPETYAGLRARHGLGPDPFLPLDNILAGAAYLREMHDRFGSPGFLAAYNAGPERYREHLATGRVLPAETRHYLAAVAPMLGDQRVDGRVLVAANPVAGSGAADGRSRPDGIVGSGSAADGNPPPPPSRSPFTVDLTGLMPRSEGLFVRLADREVTP